MANADENIPKPESKPEDKTEKKPETRPQGKKAFLGSKAIRDNLARILSIISLVGGIATAGYYYRSMTAADELLDLRIDNLEKQFDKTVLTKAQQKLADATKTLKDKEDSLRSEYESYLTRMNEYTDSRIDVLKQVNPPPLVGAEIVPLRWVKRGDEVKFLQDRITLKIGYVFPGLGGPSVEVIDSSQGGKKLPLTKHQGYESFDVDGQSFIVYADEYRKAGEEDESHFGVLRLITRVSATK